MLSLLSAGEMLRPFNKGRRETESGNLGTVVGAVPGLYGSEGVSSEEPVEETGTVEVEELRAGSAVHLHMQLLLVKQGTQYNILHYQIASCISAILSHDTKAPSHWPAH